MAVAQEYLKVITERFKEVKKLGDKTIDQLLEEDIHWQLNEASNSMTVIIKHLSGNMASRWTDFLTTDGEKSWRNRDGEFEDNIVSKQEMEMVWDKGWMILFEALNELESEDLLKTVTIRGEEHSVLEAIERQMAHYAYHVGQIVYIGKQLKNAQWKTLSIPKAK